VQLLAKPRANALDQCLVDVFDLHPEPFPGPRSAGLDVMARVYAREPVMRALWERSCGWRDSNPHGC
jgi:hypothetical protein